MKVSWKTNQLMKNSPSELDGKLILTILFSLLFETPYSFFSLFFKRDLKQREKTTQPPSKQKRLHNHQANRKDYTTTKKNRKNYTTTKKTEKTTQPPSTQKRLHKPKQIEKTTQPPRITH